MQAVNGGQTRNYSGTVTLTAAGTANSPVVIPVTFTAGTAGSNSLIVAPSSLTFGYSLGGSVPPAQTLSLTATGSSLSYSAAVTAGASWLQVSNGSGSTPGSESVSVSPGSLTEGTYSGTITITATGAINSPVIVPAILTVGTNSPQLFVAPTSLTFGYQPGGSVPATQSLSLTTTGSGVSYTSAVTAGASWLQVGNGGGATPGSLLVSVSAGSLAAGTYSGSIMITATGAANSPLVVPVALTIGSASSPSYSIPDRGGATAVTPGTSSAIVTGYGAVVPTPGSATPAGVAVFAYRQNGIVISEAGVPASQLSQSARIYAEVNSRVNTGIAIANPNSQDATVTFFFTDLNGQNFGGGTTTIPAGTQVASFLTEAPFNLGTSFQGTLTLISSVPMTAIALRGYTNERNDSLMTTLPVVSISSAGSAVTVLPQFADGGGWTTSLILTNNTDTDVAGSIRFFNGNGSVATITLGNSTDNIFFYSIRARSSQKLVTSGAGSQTTSGSVRITPISGQETPNAVAVFSFKTGGVTVSEAGVTANAGSAFDLYVESSGSLGANNSIQSGVALANVSSNPVTVNLELTALDGTPTGLAMNVTVAGQGQVSKFLGELFPGMPSSFRGVLRVSNGAGSISMIGLRARYNERGEFLITTTQPLNEASGLSNTPLYFPQIADGGGYTTQFLLFGMPGQSLSGTLQLNSPTGRILTQGP